MAREKRLTVRQRINGIRGECESVGTYREAFEPVIRTLAELEAECQAAWDEFETEGCVRVLVSTSKNGSEYRATNPLYSQWLALKAEARRYRQDLGLTPAGLKKLSDDAMKPRKKSALAEALKQLE